MGGSNNGGLQRLAVLTVSSRGRWKRRGTLAGGGSAPSGRGKEASDSAETGRYLKRCMSVLPLAEQVEDFEDLPPIIRVM